MINAMRLVQRVALLNPAAGEIGAGMLASLVADAQAILDSEIPMNRPCEPQALGPDSRRPMIAYLPVVNNPWRDAVIDQCVVACLDGDFSDPRATLARLILWHVQMALDPRISEAAAALVLATKVEALEWAATQCDDTAKSAARMAREGGTAFDDGREHAAQELAAEMRAGKGYTS